MKSLSLNRIKRYLKFYVCVVLLCIVVVLFSYQPMVHSHTFSQSRYPAGDSTNHRRQGCQSLQFLSWGPDLGPVALWKMGGGHLDVTVGDRQCRFTNNLTEFYRSQFVGFPIARERNILKAAEFLKAARELPRPSEQYWVANANLEDSHRQGDGLLNSIFRNIFNLTADYKSSSDLYVPFGTCTARDVPLRELSFGNVMMAKIKPPVRAQVLWLVSHCETISHREDYVKLLRRHIRVDIIGRCGIRGRGDVNDRMREYSKLNKYEKSLLSQYRFYLAFENAFCDDYITEKVYKVMIDDIWTVPIVMGGGNYSRDLPPDSYIDIRDFNSVKELADYLKVLISDDEKYKKYLNWRKTHQCHFTYYKKPKTFCQMLHEVYESNVQKTVDNLYDEFSANKHCYSYKDMLLPHM